MCTNCYPFYNQCLFCRLNNYNLDPYGMPYTMSYYQYYYPYPTYQINPYFYYNPWLTRFPLPSLNKLKPKLPTSINVPKLPKIPTSIDTTKLKPKVPTSVKLPKSIKLPEGIKPPNVSVPKVGDIIKKPNISISPPSSIKVPSIKVPTDKLPSVKIPSSIKVPYDKLPSIKIPSSVKLPPTKVPPVGEIDIGIDIPTVPNVKEIMKGWEQKSKQYGGQFIDESSEFWEQAKLEAKNASQTLEKIKRKFTPCQLQPGYACIEVVLISNLPIFGHQETQDVTLRICYPPNIKVKEKLKAIIEDTIKHCMKIAMKDAEKVFMAAIILSSFGALVGSLSAALGQAIRTFAQSFLDCMTSDIKIGGEEITPSIYLRKHTYYPTWSNSPCKYLYDDKY